MLIRTIIYLLSIVLTGWLSVAHAELAVPHCRLTIQDTLLPEFSCTDSTSACYAQAVAVIKAQAAQQNQVLAGCPVPPSETYLSEFDFTNQYSDYAFVFLPGLFDTASQFWTFKNTFGANNGLRVTLPGHGASAWQGGVVTPDDWITATRRAVNLAKYLGKKVIVVGQSTGAFMGIWAAAQPDIQIAGVAVFEPALKVRSYYGAALCDLPAFNLGEIPHGRFFEENIHLGCVIRKISEQQAPLLVQPSALKRLSKIPFYFFVNPYDIVVNSSSTLQFAQTLLDAGGNVTIEAYSRKYEGIHMHADVVNLPLRPRYAERLTADADFAQTLRGRNSYAEFMATQFNICDATTNATYLKAFSSAYDGLYLERASVGHIDQAIAELQAITNTRVLSDDARQTLRAYRTLYVDSLGERDGWSFQTDGVHFIMHETNWPELSGYCCTIFPRTKRNFTTTFVGPTYSTLQQQRAQVSADLAQAIEGPIDDVVALRLAHYLSGTEQTYLLSPLVASDFSSANQWALKTGKCLAWPSIPAMDISVNDIKGEIQTVLSHHPEMIRTTDDQN